jgi:hypothetical protein
VLNWCYVNGGLESLLDPILKLIGKRHGRTF